MEKSEDSFWKLFLTKDTQVFNSFKSELKERIENYKNAALTDIVKDQKKAIENRGCYKSLEELLSSVSKVYESRRKGEG
jgi:hypothetical protein